MTEARTSRNLMESMQRLMRSWPGMKQLFEVGTAVGRVAACTPSGCSDQSLTRLRCVQVAVKRNSLTTSLVLLSSVLVSRSMPGPCLHLSAACRLHDWLAWWWGGNQGCEKP